jgi:hypothetical protein
MVGAFARHTCLTDQLAIRSARFSIRFTQRLKVSPPAAVGYVQDAAVIGLCHLWDVNLAEALDDWGSFRGFCGFAANETTPNWAGFVRFQGCSLCTASIGHCSKP